MAAIEDVILEVGRLGLWLQALGVVTLFFIVFEIIGFVLNRKRLKEIETIKKDMSRIEGKIDRLIKRN